MKDRRRSFPEGVADTLRVRGLTLVAEITVQASFQYTYPVLARARSVRMAADGEAIAGWLLCADALPSSPGFRRRAMKRFRSW